MPATYEPIASTTITGTPSDVTFSSIPGTYTDLVLVWHYITSTTGAFVRLQVNSDTGSNYSNTWLGADGSSAASGRAGSNTFIRPTTYGTSGASNRAVAITQFMSYASTNVFKTILHSGAEAGTGIDRLVGLWRSTGAITSITVYPGSGTFSGGTFSLYGIKAA